MDQYHNDAWSNFITYVRAFHAWMDAVVPSNPLMSRRGES